MYIQKRTEMTCGLGGTNLYAEALNNNNASVNSSYRSIVLWKFYPPGDDSRHVIFDGYETKDDFYPKIVVNKTGPLLYHMVIKWTRYEHAGTYDCMIVTNNDSYSDVINYRNYLTVLGKIKADDRLLMASVCYHIEIFPGVSGMQVAYSIVHSTCIYIYIYTSD